MFSKMCEFGVVCYDCNPKMQVWLNLRMKKNVGEKTIPTEKVRHLRSKDGSDTSTKFLYQIRIPHIIKKFCHLLQYLSKCNVREK